MLTPRTLVFALGLVALTACGKETSGSATDDDASIMEGTTDFDPGSATLEIGDDRWDFNNFRCNFMQQGEFSFNSDSRGAHSTGAEVQMQAIIIDLDEMGRYSGANVHFEIYINDIENFETPDVSYRSVSMAGPLDMPPSGGTVVEFGGDEGNGFGVSGSGQFDDELTEADFTLVPGTLTGRCGDDSLGTP